MDFTELQEVKIEKYMEVETEAELPKLKQRDEKLALAHVAGKDLDILEQGRMILLSAKTRLQDLKLKWGCLGNSWEQRGVLEEILVWDSPNKWDSLEFSTNEKDIVQQARKFNFFMKRQTLYEQDDPDPNKSSEDGTNRNS